MQEEKVYAGATESFGKQWGPGDVVGVFLDLVDHTISKSISLHEQKYRFVSMFDELMFRRFCTGFSLNGELLMDALGGETTFADVIAPEGVGFVPAFTLGVGQKARLSYGQNVDSLKYFTTCGLQEGYEPFCV